MNKKDEIIVEFVQELLKTPPEAYTEIKAILLSINTGKKALLNLLHKTFAFVEERQPKLLEMKSCERLVS